MFRMFRYVSVVFLCYIICNRRSNFLYSYGMCRQPACGYHLVCIVGIVRIVVGARGLEGIFFCLLLVDLGGLRLCLVW
jgi:hypothetical protein